MALIKWLKGKKTWRPQRLDQPPKGSDTGARVESDVAAGSITLQRGDRLLSLVWSAKDKSKDRGRALPAGDYLLRTTRLEREEKGVWWFISSSGPGQKVHVTKRPILKLSVDDVVQFRGNARRNGGQLQLGFVITGKDKRGLSVYRKGKRVPVTYRVLDPKGKLLAKGRMNYG